MSDYIEITNPTEILRKGDEFLDATGKWCPLTVGFGWEKYRLNNRARRPVTEPKHRLLEPNEVVEKGDQFLAGDQWHDCGITGYRFEPHFTLHRRPITSPEQPSVHSSPVAERTEPLEAGIRDTPFGYVVDHPDLVNEPPHYKQHPSGVECIQVTEGMNFCLGNAVKYIWRADLKGEAIQDLEKARWYLDREIERRKKQMEVKP
jgi:hypothetical protein